MKIRTVFVMLFGLFLLSSCDLFPKNNDETPFEFTTNRTNALTLDLEYQGKSYLVDGVGIAILASCEDGDTAEFIVDDQQIRVRFLGIDTPEASHFYEPWGYHATNYVCSRLESAEVIVLERNFSGVLYDQYNRYLAFVWYDGRLINLEVIEQAFSPAVGATSLKYADEMVGAYFDIMNSGKRIYGEVDPLFDYSTTGPLTSIADIVNDSDYYNFKVVTVEGLITNMMGIHAYIEQDGYGIYFYIGYNLESKLEVGNSVRLENVRVVYDLPRRGGVHLNGYKPENTSVIGTALVEPLEMSLENLDATTHGRLLRFEALTIDAMEWLMDGSLRIEMRDATDDLVIVIHPRDVLAPDKITENDYTVGDVVDIVVTARDSLEGTILILTNKNAIALTEIE